MLRNYVRSFYQEEGSGGQEIHSPLFRNYPGGLFYSIATISKRRFSSLKKGIFRLKKGIEKKDG
jgi:hypothetical protein